MVEPFGTLTAMPLILQLIISIIQYHPHSAFHDSAEAALLDTGAALDAGAHVDHMRLLDGAGDGTHRADPGAGGAALALVGDDLIMKQGFADAGRAFLVHDMRDVLVPEEFEG